MHSIQALSDIKVHKYEMTDASAHDKQVKDFVGAKIFVPGIKNRKFKGIDNTADGVNNAAGQKPAKGGRR